MFSAVHFISSLDVSLSQSLFFAGRPNHVPTVEHVIIAESCAVQPQSDLLATEQLHLSSWD